MLHINWGSWHSLGGGGCHIGLAIYTELPSCRHLREVTVTTTDWHRFVLTEKGRSTSYNGDCTSLRNLLDRPHEVMKA